MTRIEPSYRKLNVPRYPPSALEKNISGTVYVHVWIQPDFTVKEATIDQIRPRSAHALAEGLVEKVRTWQFIPLELHGVLTAGEVIVPVNFSIGNQPTHSADETPLTLPRGVYVLDTVEVRGDH